MSTATTADRTAVEAAVEAARALVELVPTSTPLSAALSGGAPVGPQAVTAVVASYVGDTGTDMALALIDETSLADASETPTLDVTDLLRPAREAAGATTGVGVLGDVRVADATELFEDEEAVVFELSAGGGPTAGWFVVRARKTLRGLPDEAMTGSRLARISNVEMRLAVVVGHTRMPVREVLNLEPGAVVELDRSAGAPADVQLNGRTIAKGEVVVVDGGDYGVRITKILDADD
ncbi:flagellar motor switch protein FliN [Oerskovia rustica]|uniref:Flagellar motor switch protein FliN n=1 Tax=Oerskovia rustica TaxID=2762237 RepID=A0ABR8RUC1_9CELL|nr:flagellar motor switch protein FliN [Oerskovia rustica]MBD7951385.1 flagellar motor switch protein FliN [Oerskovia rustica]